MRVRFVAPALALVLLLILGPSCDTAMQNELPGAQLPAPDGIDPANPNVERSTRVVDFAGIRTIRIELPTARVNVSQAGEGVKGSLQITEIIVKEGLGYDVLEQFLLGSTVNAERSFVDDARLDVEAALAEGLADTDIVFDVRLVVPGAANVEILVGNGPVEITGLTGNVEIRTQNGKIDVDGVTGNVVAQTTNRSIDVSNVSGNVKAKTTDADIEMRLASAGTSRIAAETTSGSIRLTISKTAAASLSLNSVEGSVAANLSGFQVTEILTGDGFLEGILNGGGGQIEADSLSGEIEFFGM